MMKLLNNPAVIFEQDVLIGNDLFIFPSVEILMGYVRKEKNEIKYFC
jgi:hypothetical protein